MSKKPHIEVGSICWVFDGNHRTYKKRKDDEKFSSGSPIWTEYWRLRRVESETRVSWVLDNGDKIKKKEPHLASNPSDRGFGAREVAWSAHELVARAWWQKHRYRVEQLLRDCHDPDALRQIVELLGYEEVPPASAVQPEHECEVCGKTHDPEELARVGGLCTSLLRDRHGGLGRERNWITDLVDGKLK